MKKKKRTGRAGSNRSTSRKDERRDVEIRDTAERELRADARQARDYHRSGDNDWQWYAQSPELVRDYASYPFGVATGTRISGDHSTGARISYYTVPGIMAFYYCPAIGGAKSPTDPINIATRNIYSFVRHANSGHTNYDAPDLMIYLLAMDSCYMYLSYMRRVLGVLLDYSVYNRYYTEALLSAMGVDPADLKKHIMDLTGYINVYATKIGSMGVPASMSYMARHSWMTEGLYTDGTSNKSQTYMYVPVGYYRFVIEEGQPGSLETQYFIEADNDGLPTQNTFNDIVQFGDAMVESIVTQEDFNIMSGDILKAFGEDGIIKAMGVSPGYMVLPTYNQEVLSQMENATIINGALDAGVSQDVSIGGGYLYSGTDVVSPTGYTVMSTVGRLPISGIPDAFTSEILIEQMFRSHKVLNFHWSPVTPEQVMVATRLSCLPEAGGVGSASTSGTIGWRIPIISQNHGSEYIAYAKIFRFRYAYGSSTPTLEGRNVSTGLIYTNQDAGYLGLTTAMLSTYDWHPEFNLRGYEYTDGKITAWLSDSGAAVNPLLDFDNYTLLDRANLSNMTTCALLSEFSVPQMGLWNRKVM